MDPMLGRLQLSELNSISITIITITVTVTVTVPFLCVLTIVILRAQQLDGGGWRLNGTKVTHWAKKLTFLQSNTPHMVGVDHKQLASFRRHRLCHNR